jgi:ATP-dependent exoDNAse (exonuclease V) alpha subunit
MGGYQVLGAALTGNVTEQLQQGARIPSATIHTTLYRLEHEHLLLKANTILVVDEAGMVDTRQMERLVFHTQHAGARLVLVGDTKQLQSIEAGGAFREMEERLGTANLIKIIRQNESWARQSVYDFAKGDARRGLDAYAEKGLLSIKETREEAMCELVEQWKVQGIECPAEQMIFASTRREATMLNRLAQRERKLAGKLSEEGIALQRERLHTGDVLLFTKNSRFYGVKNGTRGEIIGLEEVDQKLSVKLDSGDMVTIPLSDYNHIQLGYAATTHKGQGSTVERAYVLIGGSMQDREISYVQMSRAREETRVFTDRVTAGENLVDLIEQMNQSHRREMAVSMQARIERAQQWGHSGGMEI